MADEYIVDIKELNKSNAGEIEFEVEILSENSKSRPVNHYRGQIKLVKEVPDAPMYQNFDLDESQAVDGRTFYQDGTLFHGPNFQAVERIINLSPEKLTMQCRVPEISEKEQGQFPARTFNPYSADVQFQCMLVWVRQFCQAGSLPSRALLGEQFRPVPMGQKFYVSMDIKNNSPSSMVADITTHDESGKVFTRVFDAEVTVSKQLNQLFTQNSIK